MQALLPDFWALVKKQAAESSRSTCKLIDLGCGTGRNTLQLLETIDRDALPSSKIQIVGLDASPGMLDVARQRVEELTSTAENISVEVELANFDFLLPDSFDAPSRELWENSDGMISTLVLEHVPLDIFFCAAASMLRPGALFLMTNMHADMGRLSQAGFVDPVTGKKVRPSRSYAHEVEDILKEATRAGFEVIALPSTVQSSASPVMRGVLERSVTSQMVEKLGRRSEKFVGVTVWLGVCFKKVANP